MTLEQLQNFIALADFRNFTKAAERNFISQSSLSRSVASLENSLGVKLLERNTRYVTLTQAGEYLREEGNRILDELYMLESHLRSMAEGKLGHLLIMMPDFFFTPFSDGCRRYSEQFPEVDLEFDTEKSWQVPERIIMHEADVGLTLANEVDSPDLESRLLFSDKLCVLVPANHPFASRDRISLSELDPKEILFYGDSSVVGSGNGAIASEEILASQSKTQKFHIIRSRDTALQRMFAGQGVMILPTGHAMMHTRIHNCKVLELDAPGIDLETGIVLVWRKDNHNPALERFLEFFFQDL